MAKGKMNKNVNHNGKSYAKDSMVESSDGNFKMLHAAGHIDSHDVVESAPSEETAPSAPEADADPEENKGSEEKPNRRRR